MIDQALSCVVVQAPFCRADISQRTTLGSSLLSGCMRISDRNTTAVVRVVVFIAHGSRCASSQWAPLALTMAALLSSFASVVSRFVSSGFRICSAIAR